jgi:hypothetical protein
MATAGTPEDENVENRPKSNSMAPTTSKVASITLLSTDSEDEEEIGQETEDDEPAVV